MGLLSWTEKSPTTLANGGVIGPDERLPWPQTGVMGVQHLIAMFGATVLAPILMGFDPNVAILMSGIGTLIFFLITGGKVPSYLGSSFAFIGVVIALQPTGAAFSPSALIALTGAACFALAMVITRRLSDCHWLALVAWQFIGSGIVGAVLSPIGWVTPTGTDFMLMAVVGLVASGCFMLITKALSLAPASLLAPIMYLQLIISGFFGWWVFDQVPDRVTLIGMAIIAGAGIAVAIYGRGQGVSAEAAHDEL